MKNIIFTLITILTLNTAIGQAKYLTKTGTLTFEASVPAFEDVAAKNKAVTAILNIKNGEFAALALVKAFRFKNALMEEHFNENYAESDHYPKATVRGKIENLNFNELSKTDTVKQFNGTLTFHGVTKEIKNSPISIKVEANKLILNGNFTVLVSDFNIDIPKIVKNKLSDKVTITFNFELTKK